MKPWYCKTEGLTDKQIADFLDFAVENGAELLDVVKGIHSECDEQRNPNIWDHFGVDSYIRTSFWNNTDVYGVDAIELKPDEIEPFILSEIAEVEPVTNQPKPETKPQHPTLRQQYAMSAMNGLLAQSKGSALTSDINVGVEYAFKIADAMIEFEKGE